MGDAPDKLIERLKGPVLNAARDLIGNYFGERKILASIPARPDHDADLVLMQGLTDAIAALEQSQATLRAQVWAEAVEAAREVAMARHRRRMIASGRDPDKYGSEASFVAEDIRALAPDTIRPIIEAAKAVVDADERGQGVGYAEAMERLAAALAAHEARHG